MKINYLRTFKEDERVSMDNYAKDMIKFQKNYPSKLELSEYIPKINDLLKFIPNNKLKMRIARYIDYPVQVKKLPTYDISHIIDHSYAHLVKNIKSKVFIMHGANDSMVPFTESIYLGKYLNDNEILISFLYEHREISTNRGILFKLKEFIKLIRFNARYIQYNS